MSQYTALIRTYNSFPLLDQVMNALNQQSIPPADFVFVDSSNDPDQKAAVKALGYRVIDYPNEDFNYSKAINIGIEKVTTDLVLIISSHVIMNDSHLVENGFKLESFAQDGYLGFCLVPDIEQAHKWKPTKIDKNNFGVKNAASNSCAMLATKYVKERPFLEEVFSAEEQEWAAYFLRTRNSFFFKVVTLDIKYLNEHINNQKLINETIALAYYTHKKMLGVHYILFRLFRSVFATLRGNPSRASLHYVIAKELYAARSNKPIKKSKYF